MAKISPRKKRMRQQAAFKPTRVCQNCHQPFLAGEGHYVMPCMGDDGFFICATAPEPWRRAFRPVATPPIDDSHRGQ